MTVEAVNAATIAFKKALIERAPGGKRSHHLGYARGDDKPEQAANHRRRRQRQDFPRQRWPAAHRRPRHRSGSIEAVLIPKYERRFIGLDGKIVAMYARGMTTLEIQLVHWRATGWRSRPSSSARSPTR